MSSHLDNPVFHDEEAARAWFEARIWSDGPFCPIVVLSRHPTSWQGASPWPVSVQRLSRAIYSHGQHRLRAFQNPAAQMVHGDLPAQSSKKGMSALQMHRMMGGSYKTAWFMMHRIREAMREGKLPGGLGGKTKLSKPMKPMSAARRAIAKTRCPRKPPCFRSSSATAKCAASQSAM